MLPLCRALVGVIALSVEAGSGDHLHVSCEGFFTQPRTGDLQPCLPLWSQADHCHHFGLQEFFFQHFFHLFPGLGGPME
jgi:hypothetical protein